MQSQHAAKIVSLPLVLIVFLAISSWAQWGANSQNIPDSGPLSRDERSVTLTGKVKTADGSALDRETTVVLQCRGAERARVHVNGHEEFAMQLTVPQVRNSGLMTAGSGFSDCDLYAESGQFKSESMHLAGEQMTAIVQVGTLLIHSVVASSEDAFTIDAASLA